MEAVSSFETFCLITVGHSICNKILIDDDDDNNNNKTTTTTTTTTTTADNLKSRKCCSVVCPDSVKLYRFTVEPSPAPTCFVGPLLAPCLPLTHSTYGITWDLILLKK
jgi:hypothetical protein